MGGKCSTYGGREAAYKEYFWWGNLREGDPGVDGRIILR
jgi:hypothetical protein